VLIENFIVVRPDNHEHSVPEIVQIPRHHLLTVVLLQHHRVVHLSRIVYLFEFLRRLDIERLDDDFVTAAVWLMMCVSALFTLFVAHVLHFFIRATTPRWLGQVTIIYEHA